MEKGEEEKTRGEAERERVGQRDERKGKSTRRGDRMRIADKKMKIYSRMEPPRNISENKVSEYTLESQIDIEKKRATQRERQTEGLKMDLCKLAPVSCCFFPRKFMHFDLRVFISST